MKLSDSQINRVCAGLLGWVDIKAADIKLFPFVQREELNVGIPSDKYSQKILIVEGWEGYARIPDYLHSCCACKEIKKWLEENVSAFGAIRYINDAIYTTGSIRWSVWIQTDELCSDEAWADTEERALVMAFLKVNEVESE